VFGLATVIWTWAYARRLGFHPFKLLAPIALAAVVAGAGAYQVNPKFAQRVDQSLAALDFSYAGLETAGSLRLHLWRNALAAMEDYPVNGVGVRAYRYAYPHYAKPGDIFISEDGTGAIYAHQLLLEVGSETGIIGLVGMLVFFVIFIRAGWGGSYHSLAWAAWLGAFAWLFPINTHTALYSAYWSLLIGWLAAVSASELGERGC
jgi:O-antigen ligase